MVEANEEDDDDDDDDDDGCCIAAGNSMPGNNALSTLLSSLMTDAIAPAGSGRKCLQLMKLSRTPQQMFLVCPETG